MKKSTELLFKTVFTLTLIIMILACNGCGGQNDKKAGEQNIDSDIPEIPEITVHVAALTGDLDAVNAHIKAGSDLNEKDEYGSTPLIISATFGKTNVALALIEAGADLNLKSDEGSTPLHTAAFFCRTEIVRALLDNGADATIKNAYGSTPYESVAVPFESVKPVYDQFSRDLGPLGLKLDYKHIENTRPEIAEMLQ